jgi:hypothetical protein
VTIRTYSSPEAFKQALEQRLRSAAKTGAEFARKRQLLVFDQREEHRAERLEELARPLRRLGDPPRASVFRRDRLVRVHGSAAPGWIVALEALEVSLR